jgi:hypothetical protein
MAQSKFGDGKKKMNIKVCIKEIRAVPVMIYIAEWLLSDGYECLQTIDCGVKYPTALALSYLPGTSSKLIGTLSTCSSFT